MDDKEDTVDSFTAALAEPELHKFAAGHSFQGPSGVKLIIMNRAQKNQLMAFKMGFDRDERLAKAAIDLKDKLNYREPGEIGRLMDRLLEVVNKA